MNHFINYLDKSISSMRRLIAAGSFGPRSKDLKKPARNTPVRFPAFYAIHTTVIFGIAHPAKKSPQQG
jgi:hypothetical protein